MQLYSSAVPALKYDEAISFFYPARGHAACAQLIKQLDKKTESKNEEYSIIHTHC